MKKKMIAAGAAATLTLGLAACDFHSVSEHCDVVEDAIRPLAPNVYTQLMSRREHIDVCVLGNANGLTGEINIDNHKILFIDY